MSGRVFSAVFAALATIATIARRLAASASAVAPGAPFEGLLTGLLAWCLRRDVTRQDRQHAGEMNLVWLPGRELANASLGLSGDSWDLTLWGKTAREKQHVSKRRFSYRSAWSTDPCAPSKAPRLLVAASRTGKEPNTGRSS